MSGFEPLDAAAFLAMLKNDTALKALFPSGNVAINANVAPREPPPFYIIFTLIADDDVNAVGGHRVMNDATFYIEAIGREVAYDVLGPIMKRIDAIITNIGLNTIVGTTRIGKFIRQNVIMRADNIDNVRWFYLGGTYQTIIYTV